MSYSGIRWRRHVLLDLEYCNAHYCDRVLLILYWENTALISWHIAAPCPSENSSDGTNMIPCGLWNLRAWLPGNLKITQLTLCVCEMLSHQNQAKENVCYDAVEQCSRECWRMAPGGWNGSSCNLYITRSEIGVMHKLCSTNCADLAILLRHMADQCEGRWWWWCSAWSVYP